MASLAGSSADMNVATQYLAISVAWNDFLLSSAAGREAVDRNRSGSRPGGPPGLFRPADPPIIRPAPAVAARPESFDLRPRDA